MKFAAGCEWVALVVVVASYRATFVSALSADGWTLLAVKESLVDTAGVLESWTSSSSTPCSWAGVLCDHQTDSVIELNLRNLNLSGTMSPKIGQLMYLQSVDMGVNRLAGNLPFEICNHTVLSYLDLGVNLLTGSIPSGLGRCTNLITLILARNRLSGAIPSTIGGLLQLQHLDFSFNLIQGSFPYELSSCVQLSVLRLHQNFLTGLLPVSIFSSFPHLTELNLGGNLFHGAIIPGLGSLASLTFLNLSANAFNGEIPTDLAQLQLLNTLDLSHNNLSGLIPSSLLSLQGLQSLNLSQNSISGGFPLSLLEYQHARFKTPRFLLHSVSALVSEQLDAAPVPATNSHHRHMGLSVGAIIGIVLGAVFFVLIVAFIIAYRRASRPKGNITPCTTPTVRPFLLPEIYRGFTYPDIMDATNILSEDNLIGKSEFGALYRATFSSGQVYAVKAIVVEQESSRNSLGQSHLREIEVAGNLAHRNLVKLVGFCQKQELTLIVSEYIPNGSLGDALREQGPNDSLSWESRFKIIMGTARGLVHLHNVCRPPIIHRDLKANNILLDADMEPRVGDFGIARMLESIDGTTPQFSVVDRFTGYMAPEYAQGDMRRVSDKCDVYSFGVVLLVVLTAKHPEEQETMDLVRWVKKTLLSEGTHSQILDTYLQDVFEKSPEHEQITLVLQTALMCVNENPAERPSMREVVEMLEYAKGLHGRISMPDLGELMLLAS